MVNIHSTPIPTKSLPEGTKVLHYLLYPGINTNRCSNGWIYVSCLCDIGRTETKVIDYD